MTKTKRHQSQHAGGKHAYDTHHMLQISSKQGGDAVRQRLNYEKLSCLSLIDGQSLSQSIEQCLYISFKPTKWRIKEKVSDD